MLGMTGAEVVVMLPFTFVTSLIIRSDPTFLTQTSNSYAFRCKNPKANNFFLGIHQLSYMYLISSRSEERDRTKRIATITIDLLSKMGRVQMA